MKINQGYIFPTIAFILWGSLYVISKTAMEVVPPLTLLFLRYGIAVAIMFVIIRKKYNTLPKIKKEHLPIFIAVAFLGYGFAIACQQLGNDMLDASLAALINSICPIFIFLFAFFLLKEKISTNKIAGVVLSIAGVYIVFGAAGGGNSLPGILISFASVFFWSLSSVWVRSISKYYDPLIITFYGIAMSLPVLAPASIIELQFRPCSFTLPAVISILYLAVFATALAHFLWNRALLAAPAGTCSLFYPVQPLTSAIMGILVLQEAITKSFVIGTIVISAGIILALVKMPKKLPEISILK